VGDSRVYRWRANRLEQLTFDHSLVWEMRAARQIPEDEVPSFIPKNVITRSLGPNPEVDIDLEGPFPIHVGDTFLLCSDGLSGPVEDEEIGTILGCLSPDEAVQALVDLANLRGGPDNITVVLVRVTGPDLAHGAPNKGGQSRARAPTRAAHPLLWILLTVFSVGTLGLAALDYPLPAAGACLAAAVVTGIAIMIQRYGGRQSSIEVEGRMRGRGPYTSCDCTADLRFVDRLAEATHQLQDAATSEDWNVEWDRFDGHLQLAIDAAKDKDFSQAIREYCQAIRFMMGELRNQRGRTRSNDLPDLPQ
jgi:protein phosphatase